jgi:predicted oxidoreductase (fatty acid repression mutant protein)
MEELIKAIEKRRTYYSIKNSSPVSDDEIINLIDKSLLNVPSAFNSQSARLVLLLNNHHLRFWDIVKEVLKGIVNPEAFEGTKVKIENCFQSGYGTVLFYEDQNVVKELQTKFPRYKDSFPVYSEHTSAMHQYAIWLLLEEAGFGASLQHYNPLIDNDVEKEWGISSDWKLIAQMPFGEPVASPDEKEFDLLDARRLILK